MKPIKALGDPHFIGTAASPLLYSSSGPNLVEGRELNSPQGIAVDTGAGGPYVYIADTGNNRVLAFRYATQLIPGAKADLILGQQDGFSTIAGGPGTGFSTGLSSPTGMVVDANGNLYVADSGNNRIVRYPSPFAQQAGYQYPDMVIGQPNLSTGTANPNGIKQNSLMLNNGSYLGRSGLAIDSAGNLWAADIGNNRVLRYNANVLKNGANNPDADIVVGQTDLVSNASLSVRADKTLLLKPSGLGFDSVGHLLVGDGGNRVLVYPANIANSNTSALRILGLPASANTAVSEISYGNNNSPQFGIATNTGTIGVSDLSNNRLLFYDQFVSFPAESAQFSPSARLVVGQASFADTKANRGNPEASSSSLSAPIDMTFAGNELYVVDAANNRVLVFPAGGGLSIGGSASRVIGQLDFPYSGVNLIEGHEFNFTNSNGYYGSAVLDTSVVPARLYVADTLNHRVLGFNNFVTLANTDFPDIVIGQPDFRRNLINYPSNDANKPNASSLYLPTGLAVDSAGNLYVVDSGNSRVLRFPTPYAGQKINPTANLVIGQANFTSVVTDPSARTMRKPLSIALSVDGANAAVGDRGFLVVSDPGLNRVLLFPKPFTSGMSATRVLGQSNFTDSASGKDTAHFSTPRGIALDFIDRLIVADSGNSRLSCFDRLSNLNNLQTPTFTITPSGSAAALTSVSTGPDGDFWVAIPGANTLVHYASLDVLPQKNFASDGSLPALGPFTVFVDSFRNVLVGDSIDRVLYYVPQVTVENAANYSGRPLSPGTIASIFPTISKNSLTSATASFDAQPNPLPVSTTLADTQVLVNGTPSAVFYVSPSQINLLLSYSLPSGGSVDLQVIRKSTGQITGAAEVALSPASPGLFTIGAAGYGQAIAVMPDNSINSATNPVIRGQYVTLYGTGEGVVPNAPSDGQVSTGALPNPNPPVITLNNGSSQTTLPSSAILYSGIAPGLVGVWQINVLIPNDAPSGSRVSILVQQYGYSSLDPSNPGVTSTYIAIK